MGREREGGKGACQLGPRRATSRATPGFSPSLARIAGRATLTLLRARRTPKRSVSGGPPPQLSRCLPRELRARRRVFAEDAGTVITIDDNNCRAPLPARPPVTPARTIDCRLSRARDRASRHLAGIA